MSGDEWPEVPTNACEEVGAHQDVECTDSETQTYMCLECGGEWCEGAE